MQFLAAREYPVIDYQTMTESVGHERLFRTPNGVFWLQMSSDRQTDPDERIIRLSARDAISWLNEAPEHFGSLWHFAQAVPASRQTSNPKLAPAKFFPGRTAAEPFDARRGSRPCPPHD
jgi:hypothetical protein